MIVLENKHYLCLQKSVRILNSNGIIAEKDGKDYNFL